MTSRDRSGGRSRDPWWASGVDPGRRDPRAEDPLTAHRAARRGDDPSAGSAYEVLEEAARVVREGVEQVAGETAAGRASGEQTGAAHRHSSAEACQLCPVCSLIRVLDEARPELVTHLTEAARHLALAAKAALDAHADSFGGPEGLERIDVEGE